MSISASDVKGLRDRTGAGMMECKKALQESRGDVEEAITWLRKQGLAKAAKKAGRAAKEGLIFSCVSADQRAVAMVDVHCETDFVAKTDEFQRFGSDVAALVESFQQCPSLNDVLGASIHGVSVEARQSELTAKLGENIGVSTAVCCRAQAATEILAHYVHPGAKIGVVVRFDDPDRKLNIEAARDVAMHVAAMNPQFLNREQVPADLLERERAIHCDQLAAEKKPVAILEKIIDGKVAKFFSEVCLEEQVFVKDPQGKRSVKQVLQTVSPKIRLLEMRRLQVGAGS